MSVFTTIIKQLINGLQSGSIYALVALGYSMVYGIIMLLNFAHGDVIMVGAYIAWMMMARFAANPIIALIAAVIGRRQPRNRLEHFAIRWASRACRCSATPAWTARCWAC